jgi:hypothetical protein
MKAPDDRPEVDVWLSSIVYAGTVESASETSAVDVPGVDAHAAFMAMQAKANGRLSNVMWFMAHLFSPGRPQ